MKIPTSGTPTTAIVPVDQLELRRDQPHSIELTRNAKGEYSYQIKLYFESPDIAPTTYLKALDAWLRDNFLPKGALDA